MMYVYQEPLEVIHPEVYEIPRSSVDPNNPGLIHPSSAFGADEKEKTSSETVAIFGKDIDRKYAMVAAVALAVLVIAATLYLTRETPAKRTSKRRARR